MKLSKITIALSFVFIGLSALAFFVVAVMALNDPQKVMDLVQVSLNNNDARSSIRGVYGGVGMTLFLTLMYLMSFEIKKGLLFLLVLWGSYALCRCVTLLSDGPLGTFGKSWLLTETGLFLMAAILLLMYRKYLLKRQD